MSKDISTSLKGQTFNMLMVLSLILFLVPSQALSQGPDEFLSAPASVSAAAPGKVTLVSPIGGTVINNTLSPDYTWNADANSTWYKLWIGQNGSGKFYKWYTAAAAGCAGGTGTCTVNPGYTLSNNQSYQWAIQTWDDGVNGPWSDEGSFSVNIPLAGKVTLVSPTGGTTVDTGLPEYTWNANANSTHYRLWIGEGGSGKFYKWYTAAEADCAGGTGTCKVTPDFALTNHHSYQWYIKTKNAGGDGPWSDAGSFNVNIPPAGKVTLVSPTGGTSIDTELPNYTWNADANSTHYKLWIGEGGSGKFYKWYTAAEAGCAGGTGTCTINPGFVLSNNATYQWYIKTKNTGGDGPWSDAGSFTTNIPLPGQVILTSPASLVDDTIRPDYTWNADAHATWYKLWIGDTSGALFYKWYTAAAAGCAGGTGTCTINPGYALTNHHAYKWYIRTRNVAGEGPWSAEGNFNVDIPLPGQATLTSPASLVDDTLRPDYTWNAVSRSTWYKLWIGDDSGVLFHKWYTAEAAGCAGGTGTCTINPVYALTNHHNYKWYIRTWNDAGNGPWSAEGNFTVDITPPAAVTVLTEPDGNIWETSPEYVWGAVAGSTWYKLRVVKGSTVLLEKWYTAEALGCPAGTGNCAATPNLTLTLGDHNWSVKSWNDGGNAPWSNTKNFTVNDATTDSDNDGLTDYEEITWNTDPHNPDTDGDALLDGWEVHGVNGLNLAAAGAHPKHKDVFVEMDYMYRASATNGLAPSTAVINSIVAVFAAAPVNNPDGVTGIKLHLEVGNQVPYDGDLNPAYTEFNALKATHFDAVHRAQVYHYMIWADQHSNAGTSSSGLTFGGIPAADFIVTLGQWNGGAGGTDNQKIGAFLHELGHNLGLKNGGGDHANDKPNYLSVMNEMFKLTGVYRNNGYEFDYSRFALPNLNESSLDEPNGLGGGSEANGYKTQYYCGGVLQPLVSVTGPVDWNCDGDAVDMNISQDINNSGSSANNLAGYNDWANLVFNGGSIGSTP